MASDTSSPARFAVCGQTGPGRQPEGAAAAYGWCWRRTALLPLHSWGHSGEGPPPAPPSQFHWWQRLCELFAVHRHSCGSPSGAALAFPFSRHNAGKESGGLSRMGRLPSSCKVPKAASPCLTCPVFQSGEPLQMSLMPPSKEASGCR